MKLYCVFIVLEWGFALGEDGKEVGFGFVMVLELADEKVPVGSEGLESGRIGWFNRLNDHLEAIKYK